MMNRDLNLLDVAPLLSDINSCMRFLRQNNLLKQDHYCCNQPCSKVMDVSLTDREIFQCRICTKRCSNRDNSFWAKSKLKLTILLAIVYFFCQDISVTQCVKMLKGMYKKNQ